MFLNKRKKGSVKAKREKIKFLFFFTTKQQNCWFAFGLPCWHATWQIILRGSSWWLFSSLSIFVVMVVSLLCTSAHTYESVTVRFWLNRFVLVQTKPVNP